MSLVSGPGLPIRSAHESKRLTDIVFTSHIAHLSRSFPRLGLSESNDGWLASAAASGLLRAVMRGSDLYMDDGSGELASAYIKRRLAESPEGFFYIIDDPTRGDDPTFFLVERAAATRILALGWMP